MRSDQIPAVLSDSLRAAPANRRVSGPARLVHALIQGDERGRIAIVMAVSLREKVPHVALSRVPELILSPIPPGMLGDLRADPTHALETLVTYAVKVHGPAAQKWRDGQPGWRRRQETIARAAIRRSVRRARLEGIALGFGGSFTIAPDMALLVWILSQEVIYVSAAYGLDPADPARAAELLVIGGIYDTIDEAQAALDKRGEALGVALTKQAVTGGLRRSQLRSISARLALWSSGKAVRFMSRGMIPGIGAVTGAIDNGAAANRLGDKAIAFYSKQAREAKATAKAH